eukprot:11880670-Prorocentrum_lima.AAC.1
MLNFYSSASSRPLGVSVEKELTDKCDICIACDFSVKPDVAKAVIPNFFEWWHKLVENNTAWYGGNF